MGRDPSNTTPDRRHTCTHNYDSDCPGCAAEDVTASPDQPAQMKFAAEHDTTVTQVAVKGNDGHSQSHAAARYIINTFASDNPVILAVWGSGERDYAGNPVFNVEWEADTTP